MTDAQKANLFDFVKRHIKNHIKNQLKEGVSESGILKELSSEHSRHRSWLLGKLQAKLHDLQTRTNDTEAERFAVEKAYGKKNWNDEKIDKSYDIMTSELKEMIDYAGVLYREIALHRAGRGGMEGTGFQLLSWADAERQRDEREGCKFSEGNEITKKHSEKNQGAFSFEKKVQSALKKDPSVKILLENLGGKFINGKVVADEKTRAKIESFLDDKAIKILGKYSRQGAGDTTLKNFVADEKLTSQQKLLKNFSGQMGLTLQFFDNDNADFRGAYTNGVTYLNVNSNIPLGQVFWHETLHWLKANNPKLFTKLADAANLSDAQLQDYLDTTGRVDLKNRAEITEEILADSLHKILDKVHDKNLLEKIVGWIRDTLSKFKEIFHNKQGGLTTAQYERIANTFGKIAKNLTDEDGNKIFRFNSRTKKLELANGHQLPKIDLRFDNSEKYIDNEADMNGKYRE